jgi:hypothetical protein
MDHPLVVLTAVLFVLVVLDLASLRWGADSRPGPEDRQSWS